ncbi:hypothetical protein [Nocardioides xinjiangensis]|uniref:hypothetical protein n=1 Tax=Nocardioides xinjiangensis TaxID=2817376 RepID=UPI001B3141B4|nr:hypothetical protein [Nocardioides sp. SYSU D00778]
MDDPTAAPGAHLRPQPRADSRLNSLLDSRLDSWPAHLATAAATGLVTTLMPVQRWSRGARWTMHGGTGVLAAAGTALVVRHPERFGITDRPRTSHPQALAVAAPAVVVGVAVAGASRGGQAVDAWAERRLVARGVRRPRLWMGLGAAGLSLAMSVGDRRRAARQAQASPGSDGGDGKPGAGG